MQLIHCLTMLTGMIFGQYFRRTWNISHNIFSQRLLTPRSPAGSLKAHFVRNTQMTLCQICEKHKKNGDFFAYRYECSECRAARKKLKKEGVSLKALKAYLLAIGHASDFRIIDDFPSAVSSTHGLKRPDVRPMTHDATPTLNQPKFPSLVR